MGSKGKASKGNAVRLTGTLLHFAIPGVLEKYNGLCMTGPKYLLHLKHRWLSSIWTLLTQGDYIEQQNNEAN